MNLNEIATELSHRLMSIFLCNSVNYRPVHGGNSLFQNHPDWHDLILFYEYFHGDNGAGLGANHQTGWTGLVAYLIHHCGQNYKQRQAREQPAIASDLVSLSGNR